jgi:hypothetical protein
MTACDLSGQIPGVPGIRRGDGRMQGPGTKLTAIWGVIAGLLIISGEAPGVTGIQAVIGLVVSSRFSFGPEQAALSGLWALCCGMIQITLAAVTWPIQRFPGDRAMPSAGRRMLAARLRSLASGPPDLLDPGILGAASDPGTRSPRQPAGWPALPGLQLARPSPMQSGALRRWQAGLGR